MTQNTSYGLGEFPFPPMINKAQQAIEKCLTDAQAKVTRDIQFTGCMCFPLVVGRRHLLCRDPRNCRPAYVVAFRQFRERRALGPPLPCFFLLLPRASMVGPSPAFGP